MCLFIFHVYKRKEKNNRTIILEEKLQVSTQVSPCFDLTSSNAAGCFNSCRSVTDCCSSVSSSTLSTFRSHSSLVKWRGLNEKAATDILICLHQSLPSELEIRLPVPLLHQKLRWICKAEQKSDISHICWAEQKSNVLHGWTTSQKYDIENCKQLWRYECSFGSHTQSVSGIKM